MDSKGHFVSATEEDIQHLRDGRHEVKTKSSTTWGVKLFKCKWNIDKVCEEIISIIILADTHTI